MAYDARRATRDIDAVFEPKTVIYEAAAEVAERRGLPPGWLNDAVKALLAGDDPAAAPILDVPGLRCVAASPRIPLAMKVLAHRVGEDEDDVPPPAPAQRSAGASSMPAASIARRLRRLGRRVSAAVTASPDRVPSHGERPPGCR